MITSHDTELLETQNLMSQPKDQKPPIIGLQEKLMSWPNYVQIDTLVWNVRQTLMIMITTDDLDLADERHVVLVL